MAGGRSPRSAGSRPSNDPLKGLVGLGQRADNGDSDSGPVANQAGLTALGDRIDGRPPGGVPKHRAGRRRRWSRRRKILVGLGVFVLLIVAVVGAGYGYLRYEWSKVAKVACTSCTAPASPIAPFNVLLVGSDTRLGNSGQAAQSFGTTTQSGGQHSDTIKIVHVDPQTGTARLLSIPRDTWVNVTGLPTNEDLNGPEKINASFNNISDPGIGANSLIQTIEQTFGIPISHFVVVDFIGLINAVQSVGGINMQVNFPVRDNDNGNNNSGLNITTTGCQTLSGDQTLALARSRFFEYDDPATGGWTYDQSSDIGRIERQNLIIEALMSKIESTYNPFTLHSFLSSVVNDIEIDKQLGLGELYDLANKYHAFSPSKLQDFTLPTTPAVTPGGADVELVQEPQAQQMLTQFLGAAPNAITTPPLDQYSNPISVPDLTTTTLPAAGSTTAPPTTAPIAANTVPAYDPTPC
jgi:LCP family protein required for cell wall assembly